MAKRSAKPKEAEAGTQIRKVTLRWPRLLAEASVHVAISTNASAREAESLALTVLRSLIMQDSIMSPPPERDAETDQGTP